MSTPPSSSSPSIPSTPTAPVSQIPASEDGAEEELPIALSASVLLTNLPRDGKQALDKASHPKPRRVQIRFKSIGSAPVLKTPTAKVNSNQRFESVVKYLRDKLRLGKEESLFVYINQSFAPALDEGVEGLWDSFQTDGSLIVCYCMTAAFG